MNQSGTEAITALVGMTIFQEQVTFSPKCDSTPEFNILGFFKLSEKRTVVQKTFPYPISLLFGERRRVLQGARLKIELGTYFTVGWSAILLHTPHPFDMTGPKMVSAVKANKS